MGHGLDSIDLEAAARVGIKVDNSPGAFQDAVADVALGYILMLSPGLHVVDRAVRNGEWPKPEGRTLRGQTLGVVGYGAIGRGVVERARAFGMEIVANDVRMARMAPEEGTRFLQLAELLEISDVVCLCCNLTGENKGLINRDSLARMKPTAFRGRGDAKLVLKTLHSEAEPAKLDRLKSRIDRCGLGENVILVNEGLSRDDLMGLVNAADCYVSLHRTEGLGMGMLEAMALGKPVIATRYGGNLDFMDNENSLLIDFKMTRLRADEGPYRKGWKWAAPNLQKAAEAMRRVYSERAFAKNLGKKAQRDVLQRISAEKFTRELYGFMMSL